MNVSVDILINNIDGGTGTFMFQLLDLLPHHRLVKDVRAYSLKKPTYSKIVAPSRFSFFQSPFPIIEYIVPLKFLFEIIALIRYFRIRKPAVVIAVDIHCAVLICLIRRFLYPTKVILTFHNNSSQVLFHKLDSISRSVVLYAGRTLFPTADRSIAVSEGVKKDCKKIFGLSKISVIHYGINALRIKKMHHRHFCPDRRIKLITVTRLEKQKDIQTLLRACSLLKDDNIPFTLSIVGDGSQRKEVERLIYTYSIKNHVRIVGWKTYVDSYLSDADIFAFSSHYEGFGYVLLEAMAFGLPIVSSDCPYGPSEILEKGRYGILFPPGDSLTLYKNLKRLMRSLPLREKYHRLSLARIKQYSEDRMRASFISEIQKLTSA